MIEGDSPMYGSNFNTFMNHVFDIFDVVNIHFLISKTTHKFLANGVSAIFGENFLLEIA